jgi:hypothetical protein
MASLTWIFEQLGGFRTRLELADHAAPFGGARRGSVADEEVEVRESEVYYDGNPNPTRHVGGIRHNPIEIHGIWMDRRGGRGFARFKKREVKEFIAACQLVRITWGDNLSVVGLIKSARFSNEAEFHIPWEMKILVNEDLFMGAERSFVSRVQGPSILLREINKLQPDKLLASNVIKGSFVDILSSLVDNVNNASAALRETAEGINSFANAPFAEIRRLRAGLGQFATAVGILRRTVDETEANVATESENTSDWQVWWNMQAAWSQSSSEIIYAAFKADREALLAEQGSVKAFFPAREGDTWESISRAVYNGDPTRAEDIRLANGIDGGIAPIPGTVYFCPV